MRQKRREHKILAVDWNFGLFFKSTSDDNEMKRNETKRINQK